MSDQLQTETVVNVGTVTNTAVAAAGATDYLTQLATRLSAVEAQLAQGTGPIARMAQVEQALEPVIKFLAHLARGQNTPP